MQIGENCFVRPDPLRPFQRIFQTEMAWMSHKNDLDEPYQSGYKSHHSTETALIYITNSLLQSMDRNETVAIAFLDLSAAFDVVDHRTLLQRLKASQGIEDTALQWIESYLSERTQQVCIGDAYSAIKALTCGLPQGSKYGPQAYKQYTKPLGTLAPLFVILFHFYADDSQFWKSFNPACPHDVQKAIEHLETSLGYILK